MIGNTPHLNTVGMVGVFGHGCLDQLLCAAKVAEPGKLEETEIRWALGGPIYNVGGTLARLGVRTHIVGAVGADFFSQPIQALVDHIRNHSAIFTGDIDHVTYSLTEVTAPNSVSIVLPYDDRAFMHQPGTNTILDIDMLDTSLADQMSIAHFGYPALLKKMTEDNGAQTIELFTRLKKAGATTSLDHVGFGQNSWAASFDWHAYHKEVLPLTDVFSPSIDELCQMLFGQRPGDDCTLSDLRNISAQLLDLGTKIVMLKLGAGGLYLRSADLSQESNNGRGIKNAPAWSNREIYAPAFIVDQPKTTGAGDAAISGLLAAMNSDIPPDQAIAFAAATASCCCTRTDATSGIPSWNKVWQSTTAQSTPWFDPKAEGCSKGEGVIYGPSDRH